MQMKTIVGAAMVWLAFATAPLAQGGTLACTGVDLLAHLRTEKPAAYKTFDEEASGVPNAEGLLWRIQKPGVKPSYLFGTVHLTDPRVTDFPPEVEKAFAESSTLALELAGTGDQEATMDMAKRAISMGRNLSAAAPLANFTPDERRSVVNALKARGLPSEFIQTFKPWFLAVSLALPACETVRQNAGIEMVDQKIANKARRRSLPIVGLETAAEQLAMLTSLQPWVYEAMLRDSTRSEERSRNMTELMVRLYLERRIGAMVPAYRQVLLPEENMAAFEIFMKALLGPRNAVMRERARPFLEKGGVFIAVGALHLPFEDGLVELFRKDGYEVTRVW